jgi:hypothetical protein
MENDMKRVFLITLSRLALLLGCVLVAPLSGPTPTPTSAPFSTATPLPTPTPAVQPPTVEPKARASLPAPDWADMAPYKSAMLPSFVDDVNAFADATRYWLDLEVDLERLVLDGVAQIRYTNHESEPLDEIVLRLLPNTPGYGASMAVGEVSVDGVPVRPRLRFENSALYVPLAAPLPPGGAVELRLAFASTLPTDPAAGYAQYGYIDGVLALPNAYPLIPVYDDEGWNVELAPPYGDATFTDTALYLVHITLPAEMILATSGVIVDRTDDGEGMVTYTCASGPMRDFNLVASAGYATASESLGEVTVTSYYVGGEEQGGQRTLDYAVQALRIYQELFGPYPFTELDVMATPTTAGGIEYPGLIVIAWRLYDQAGGFFELATVHEVAHQWWYSMVGNDQLDEPWLDEALTQYTSLLYFEQRYGPEGGQQMLESTFMEPYEYLQESDQDMPAGLPVADYPEGLYGAVVYGKGPLFFHAVRQQTGDETFYSILRTYFEQYRYKVAYPQDLLDVAEQVSGQDLDPLYERWIR